MRSRNRFSRLTLALTVILGQALAQFEATVTGNPDNLAFVDFPATVPAGETVSFVVKQPVVVQVSIFAETCTSSWVFKGISDVEHVRWPFSFQSTYASIELMAGTSGDGSSTVEDILGQFLFFRNPNRPWDDDSSSNHLPLPLLTSVHHLSRASDASTSVLPKNLPGGNYHSQFGQAINSSEASSGFLTQAEFLIFPQSE